VAAGPAADGSAAAGTAVDDGDEDAAWMTTAAAPPVAPRARADTAIARFDLVSAALG
jgi:hypothetical protein